MTEQSEAVGLCWECGYSLRGLESRRCPECGRPFDPADPATMNMGRRVGWLTGWLMRPPGVMIHGLTAVAVVMSLWGTATPGRSGEYAHHVLSLALSPPLWRHFWEHELGYSEHTGRFVLAVLTWGVVLALWVLRRVARGITVRLLSRKKPATFAYWRRWLVTPLVLGLTLLVCRTWLPVYLGFWVSKGSFERAPRSATTQATAGTPWLGVYPPHDSGQASIYRGSGNRLWVHVRYSAGFVRNENGPPPADAVPGYGPTTVWQFRPMGGGWYAFYEGY